VKNIISKAAPYIFLIGLFCIVLDGLWIVERYDSKVAYPLEAFIYLIFGICLTSISILFFKKNLNKEEVKESPGKEKDNRIYIRKVCEKREKLGNRLIVVLVIILIIIYIVNPVVAFRLLQPILFCGIILSAFLYIMYHYDGEMADGENLKPKNDKIRRLMNLIDYRNHFFSLSLALFIMIILSYLLSQEFGYTLAFEVSGNPRYVMTLQSGVFCLSGIIFYCGFLYIIHHSDFFGIRQANQSYYKVLLIHFMEFIIVGVTFFIWLIALFGALLTSF
jgi:hypothetical protein